MHEWQVPISKPPVSTRDPPANAPGTFPRFHPACAGSFRWSLALQGGAWVVVVLIIGIRVGYKMLGCCFHWGQAKFPFRAHVNFILNAGSGHAPGSEFKRGLCKGGININALFWLLLKTGAEKFLVSRVFWKRIVEQSPFKVLGRRVICRTAYKLRLFAVPFLEGVPLSPRGAMSTDMVS